MENKLTQKEINKIIENHKHWLNKDVDGWNNMKADFFNQDLSDANLRGADLSRADFCGANLCGADLSDADLSDAVLSGTHLRNADLSDANLSGAVLSGAVLSNANLSYANLRYANLRYVNLRYANLSDADLRYANLCDTNLSDANLCGADLSDTDLSDANLCDANLSDANLCDANLSGADIRGANLSNANLLGTKNMMYIPMACPEEGSFIGFKKAVYADKDYIVKLEILADALRSSATSRKCRCNKAKVLEIQNINGSKANIDVVHSTYDPSFQYKAGQIVEEPNFDDNRFNKCSKGIHFFINRQEAVNY